MTCSTLGETDFNEANQGELHENDPFGQDDRNQVAYANDPVKDVFLFPWGDWSHGNVCSPV
jgi:hypothetical protein